MALRARLTPALLAQYSPYADRVVQLRRRLPPDSAGVVVAVKLSAALPVELQRLLQMLQAVLAEPEDYVVAEGARP